MFTSGSDQVNFNVDSPTGLRDTQKLAIANGADLYHGLGGDDVVTLPSVANYNEDIGNGKALSWIDSPFVPFVTGSQIGDTYQVYGTDGDYFIAAGAGEDFITITGNGSSTIAAGTGSDYIEITGKGTNQITGDFTGSVSISGGGSLAITGSFEEGTATIGAGSQRFAIGRVCVVADRGMISAQTIASLEERGLEYILGVRERSSKEVQEVVLNDPVPSVSLVIPRRGRRDTELEAKEVRVGGRRYIVCRNLAEAKRDAEVREAVLRHLRSALRGGDKTLVGNSAYRRYLKTPDEKHFEIDDNRVIEDARYDGLYVLRTNTTLNALAVMLRYRELLRVEDIFKTTKAILDTRPIYHKTDATIRGHVFCSFLALVVRKAPDDRLAAADVKPEWGRLLMDLDRLQDIEMEQDGKYFIVRTPVTGDVGRVFQAVGLALPPNMREAEAVVHTSNRPRPKSAWC